MPSDSTEELIARVLSAWEHHQDGASGDAGLMHVEHTPARDPRYAALEPPLHPLLAARLRERGIESLYRHQVAGIRSVREGRNTVVVAGTSAGKTLCYQAPIVERCLAGDKAGALLLYPTKALARDQLRSFTDLGIPDVKAATYDGDTPTPDRARIRRTANVVLTNPDMLHVGILPSHGQWADFLHRLEMVVVDEMHTLRGIFGTHVAMILRRLRRLASHYGADPTFVFGSATIGNPEQLASSLCGAPVSVVHDDGSPRGEQWLAVWNPPVVDEFQHRRRSSLTDATERLTDLVAADLNTIAFTRSRRATELMYRWASDRLGADRVAPYRAGYLPEQRRRIESRLFSGELGGVVATNALELGIDVGSLDAAVITTFPGTISSFRQQAGRAGRRREASLVTLVAGEDALDQYFVSHPDELFSRPPEAAVINPANPLVAEAHAACAAYELPLRLEDRALLGETIEEAANRLVQQGHLRLKEGGLYWSRRNRPAPMVDIRSSGGPTYPIVGPDGAVGTLDEARAFRDGHPGAIYLHQGETYLVTELDIGRREVRVEPATIDYYTQPKVDKQLTVVDLIEGGFIGRAGHHHGRVRVETTVVGYQRRRLGSREVLDTIELDLPTTTFETEGIWFTLPSDLIDDSTVDHRALPGALHAAEHAGIGMMPLMAICDRWDIGGLSTAWHASTGQATIYIYEAYPGGAGVSPIAYRAGVDHLRATWEAIVGCDCRDGCPSCVQSPKCGNLNDPLDKDGAARLLESILADV